MNDREIQLLSFEAKFEAAVAAILETAGLGPKFLSETSGAEALPDARIECLSTAGDETERSDAGGEEVLAGFMGMLEISIHTRAEEDVPGLLPRVGTLHQEFAARVRAAFLEQHHPFTPENLPDYSVSHIKHRAGTRAPDPRWFEHRTVLRFEIWFDILEGAWSEPVAR